MKSTLAVLSLLFSLGTLAAQATTVKVADGTSAYCKNERDTQSRKNAIGLYRIKAKEASIQDSDTVAVKIDLSFLKCLKSSSRGFNFKEVAPFSPNSLFKTSGNRIISVKTEEITLKGYKDGVYKLLVDQKIEKNLGRQEITLLLPIESILNDRSQNRPTYDANIDLMITKKLNFSTPDGELSVNDQTTYGAFRIHLNLDLEKGIALIK